MFHLILFKKIQIQIKDKMTSTTPNLNACLSLACKNGATCKSLRPSSSGYSCFVVR